MALYGLIFFTIVNYVAPQEYLSFLKPFRLAFSAIIVAVLAYMAGPRHGKPFLRIDSETNLLFLLVLLVAASIPGSMWRGGSLDIFLNVYVKSVILFLLLANVITSLSHLKKILWTVMGSCVFLMLIAIKNYATGNFELKGMRIIGGLSGIAHNPNDLALALSLTLPIAFAFLQISKKPILRGLYLGYIGLGTIAIICTFSRSGFITLSTAFALYFLGIVRKNVFKAICLLIIITPLAVTVMPASYSERISSIFDISKDETGSAQERKEITFASLEVMKEYPLFGVGLGCNILGLVEKGINWRQSHNVYLQLGCDVGIPGLTVFLLLFLKLIKDMNTASKNRVPSSEAREMRSLARGLRNGLICFAVGAPFSPVAYNFYFYYLGGFALALKNILRDEKRLTMQQIAADQLENEDT